MNYSEDNCSWSNLNPKACKNLDSSKIKPFAMNPPSSKSHPALVKERKDEQATTGAWSLVPPHKKPNFPAIPDREKTKTPTNYPDVSGYPYFRPVYASGYQYYTEIVNLLKTRWGVPAANIGFVGFMDETNNPSYYDSSQTWDWNDNWVVVNESTRKVGTRSISNNDEPPGFHAYGPYPIKSGLRRWFFNFPNETGSATGGGGPMVDKGIVNTYAGLLETQLNNTWNASGVEEKFTTEFRALALRTTLYKPGGTVQYLDSEKKMALTNVQNIILVLISLEDALKQAAYSGNGGALSLFLKWRKDMDNTNFVLTVDYVMTGLENLQAATIISPLKLYKPWKPCDPKSPDYEKCMSTPIPLEPSIPPPPIENLVPGKKIEPTWEEDFWADLDYWAKYLMLTDDQLLWVLAGSVPLTMYCYEVQDFSYLPVVLIPALFFNFTKDYIENTLAESQSFVNFVQKLAEDFYTIKRDIKKFSATTINVIEWTLAGGALMMGTTFLGAKIPLIEPYVMLANFGIMGVVAVYDLWEMLPWFLPSIF